MSLLRYEPYSVLSRFQNELNRLGAFDPQTSDAVNDDNSSAAVSQWRPAVDIKEDAEKYTILADLPGIEPDNIEISMENGVLSIQGERSAEKVDEKEDYKRVERSYGNFYRRFTLPDTANADKIEANSKHGVLEIVLPKHAKPEPKRITVNS